MSGVNIKRKIRLGLSYLALLILSVAALYPAIWILLSSLRPGKSLYSKTLIPETFTLEHYRALFYDNTLLFPLMVA